MKPLPTSGGNPFNAVLPDSNVDTLLATGNQQPLNSNNANALPINAKAAQQKIDSAVQDPNALLNIHTPSPIAQSLASAPGSAYNITNNPDININSAVGANDFQARMREFIKTADGSFFSQLKSDQQKLLLSVFDACASPGAQDPSFSKLNNDKKIEALGLLKTCLENILRSGKPTSRLIDGSYPNEAAKRFLEEILHTAEELLKQYRQNNQGIFSSAGNALKDLVGANKSAYPDPNSSLAIPKNTNMSSTTDISDGNSNALSSDANAGNHATRTPKSPREGTKLTSMAGKSEKSKATTTTTPTPASSSTTTTLNIPSSSTTTTLNIPSSSSTTTPNIPSSSTTTTPNTPSSSTTITPNTPSTSTTITPNTPSTSTTTATKPASTSTATTTNTSSSSTTTTPNTPSTSTTTATKPASTSTTTTATTGQNSTAAPPATSPNASTTTKKL